jgi:hypothetical protein
MSKRAIYRSADKEALTYHLALPGLHELLCIRILLEFYELAASQRPEMGYLGQDLLARRFVGTGIVAEHKDGSFAHF